MGEKVNTYRPIDGRQWNGAATSSNSSTMPGSPLSSAFDVDDRTRTLYIFGGKTTDSGTLSDMYTYHIATKTTQQVFADMTRDCGIDIQASFQRAVIDSTLQEIYMFSGLAQTGARWEKEFTPEYTCVENGRVPVQFEQTVNAVVGEMPVPGLAVSSRHPYLLSCGEDEMVCRRDLEANKIIRHYHLSGVYTLSLRPTLAVLITAGHDASSSPGTHRLTGIRPRRRCVFVPQFFCSLYERIRLNSLESSVMSGAGGGAVERHKRHHGKRI
ncbi:hypothetical protein B0H14DRAFT_752024 [Mycena olivaceomarginata]|nr:hypothetical protein B0H14DRAFT_752024 [Mycena olivaceomarginata]